MEQGRSTSLRLQSTKASISESLGKLPPQELEIEEAVLGAAMLEKNAALIAIEILHPDDFYKEAHVEIFKAIQLVAKQGASTDMRLVIKELRKANVIEQSGGEYYIAELTSKVSSAANMEYYCRIIKQTRLLRDLIIMASTVSFKAYEPDTDPFEVLDDIRKFLFTTEGEVLKGKEQTLQSHIDAMVKELQNPITEGQISGITTGFPKLDKIGSGWQNTDLVIIAARPGMGKTAFVVSCMRNASVIAGIPVAMFSLEMSSGQLVRRMAASETEISLTKFKNRNFEAAEWDQFNSKVNSLYKAKIFLDDTPALSIMEMRSRARRMVEKYGVKLIIVDYIQLMRGEFVKGGNREGEIASISRGLKQMGKELNVPVLALSQLSREVEKRPNKKPILSDLRESGAIEQDADIVIFLWRPEYYHITEDGDGKFLPGATAIDFAKHRNGDVTETFLGFVHKFTTFKHIDSPYVQSTPEPPTEENPYPGLKKLYPNGVQRDAKDSDEAPF